MAGDCGSTCPVEGGFYGYKPNVGGNAVLLAAFAVLILVALYLGVRLRTPVFSATLATGMLLEALGFLGRVLLNGSPDSQSFFVLSLLGTLLGPVCVCGAIFLTLPHILTVYGDHLSPLRPVLVGIIFYGLAAIAAVIQVIGAVYVANDMNGLGVSTTTCEGRGHLLTVEADGRNKARRWWTGHPVACSACLQRIASLVHDWTNRKAFWPRPEALGHLPVGPVQALLIRYVGSHLL